MAETVLVTETEWAKGRQTFEGAQGLAVRPAPESENALAKAVAETACRAAIVGVAHYGCPLYEALKQSAGDRGAIIARFGVGHEGITKSACRERGIVVTNTPGALDVSVAEHVFALIGALTRRIAHLDAAMREGRFEPVGGIELRGRTLVVLGYGAIGRRVATAASRGFGMRVIAADVMSMAELEMREGMAIGKIKSDRGIDDYTTDLEAALAQADIVSLHMPSMPQTRHFVNAQRLSLMGPDSILINAARGTLVDEVALFDALTAGRLGGAALDVFETEPYLPAMPQKDLRSLPNVVVTPHVASNTREANRRMAHMALDNVRRFLSGEREGLNRVDG